MSPLHSPCLLALPDRCAPRADTPHCMSFSNKACFHGDHLSPSCATFYGSRAHNACAVSYPIFSSPGLVWILSLGYFFSQPANQSGLFFLPPHAVEILYMLVTWTISCLIKTCLFPMRKRHRKCSLTKMRADCWDVHLLQLDLSLRFSFTPLSFFLSVCGSFSFFPPLTFSWNNVFPRGRFSPVGSLEMG